MVGKRKRTSSDNVAHGDHTAERTDHSLRDWIKDTIQVLKKHDITPSIFESKITSSCAAAASPLKRGRAAIISDNLTTIDSQANANAYTAVEQFVVDVETAARGGYAVIKQQVTEHEISIREQIRLESGLEDLRLSLDRLIRTEMSLPSREMIFTTATSAESDPEAVRAFGQDDGKKVVLTLCGGERTAKQLFSSLAKQPSVKIDLNSQALPNGINPTSVLPVHSLGGEKAAKATIGFNFTPSASLKALSLPKSSAKHTTTRSSSVNWVGAEQIASTAKDLSAKDTSVKQPLTTGQWLNYNVPPSTDLLTSPDSKRKHRERALSTGEPQAALTEEAIAAHAQAKEDALFRSVFSSFAPEHDNSGAVVTTEQKNRLWWTKCGESLYQQMLEARGGDTASEIAGEEDVDDTVRIDEALIEAGLDSWEEPDRPLDLQAIEAATEQPAADTDLLREISELLEILNSHQRVRNLQQPTSRPVQGQKEHLRSMPADTTTPSAAELETYASLRRNLVDVIADLPPSLLARLDNDKDGVLKLSTRVRVPGTDQKGTLTEDELSKRIKNAARPSATTAPYPSYGSSSAPRGTYGNTASANSYTPRSSGYTPSSTHRASNNNYSSQYPARSTPASQYPTKPTRPSYGQQFVPPRTANSYTDRFPANSSQHGGQSQYSQYSSSYRPHAAPLVNAYGQPYNTTPQARAPPHATPSTAPPFRGNSQTDYPSRAPVPAASSTYNYGATHPAAAGATGTPSAPIQNHTHPLQGGGVSPPAQTGAYQHHASKHGSMPMVNGQAHAVTPAADAGGGIRPQKLQQQGQEEGHSASSGTPQAVAPSAPMAGQVNGTSTETPPTNGVLAQ